MSKLRVSLTLSIVLFSFKTFFAQSAQDSIVHLYNKYLFLSQKTSQLDSMSGVLAALQTQYQNFDGILKSNNESLKRITNAQLFTFDRTLKQQRAKIVNTVDFVRSANTSLNALQVAGSVSSYLDNIGQLNNPSNNELGFALSDDIVKLLDARILSKKGLKTNPSKFTAIVKEVLNAPITNTFTKSIPLASHIKGVLDLVMNLTISEKNVEVEDLIKLKGDLKRYIEHYEGLEQANMTFTGNLNTLNVRLDALKSILRNYATERLRPIHPSVNLDTFRNFTQLVNRYCDKEDAQMRVDRIMEECKNTNGTFNYEKALGDKRLAYPEYAINQAQVLYDELESISRGFLSNLNTYQRNIDKVLINSKNNKLGDATKIDIKIKALEGLLNNVTEAVKNSVNLDDLQNKLQRINGFMVP
jgi:hypothetical protein